LTDEPEGQPEKEPSVLGNKALGPMAQPAGRRTLRTVVLELVDTK